jgi:hypothetical protein
MPKIAKVKKNKLSKEERSQIAKDRWAKIKAAKAQNTPQVGKVVAGEVRPPFEIGDTPDPSGRDENGVPSIVGLGDGAITPNGVFVPDQPPVPVDEITLEKIATGKFAIGTAAPAPPPVPAPAPQLTPVAPKKPKRYTGPKEFSVALKAAENRLAKAINERAEAMGKLAGLNAEIPSLLQIIQALKGSSNLPPTPFDFSGGVPNAQAFQAPIDPQAALMAAMAAPPVSRASGGAVQFSPDVVGSLEGPDDDNPDKFLEGPHAGGGWIGG